MWCCSRLSPCCSFTCSHLKVEQEEETKINTIIWMALLFIRISSRSVEWFFGGLIFTGDMWDDLSKIVSHWDMMIFSITSEKIWKATEEKRELVQLAFKRHHDHYGSICTTSLMLDAQKLQDGMMLSLAAIRQCLVWQIDGSRSFACEDTELEQTCHGWWVRYEGHLVRSDQATRCSPPYIYFLRHRLLLLYITLPSKITLPNK